MTVLDLRLTTAYPCCHGRSVIHATHHVPVEKYDRVCPNCGTHWQVKRVTMKWGPEVRIDKLEWEATDSATTRESRLSSQGG